jgi:hypothetical protein
MEQENNQELQNSPEGQTNQGEVSIGEENVTHESSKNMLIVVVIAVIVVALALMYIWGSSIALKNKIDVDTPPIPSAPTMDEQVETLKQVSTSDEIDAIEADIQNTDLENIDADLEQIEAGLEIPTQ